MKVNGTAVISLILITNTYASDFYKCTVNGTVKFSDKPCGQNQIKMESYSKPEPKNLVLTYGGSACKKLDTWKKVVDLIVANKSEKVSRLLDRECSWLKEKSSITGPYKEVMYKESKFVLVKHYLFNSVWIEPSNYESKKRTYKKAVNTNRLSSAITRGYKKIVKATDYSNNWPFPLDSGGTLYCKNIDSRRKAVWLNGTHATYALNGQAMSWMGKHDFVGVGGKPTKIGRDNSKNFKGLSGLISDGLVLCK